MFRPSMKMAILIAVLVIPMPATAGGVFHGILIVARPGMVIIHDIHDVPMTFAVRTGTVITRDGVHAQLENLFPGDLVTVTTTTGRIAVTIDAHSLLRTEISPAPFSTD